MLLSSKANPFTDELFRNLRINQVVVSKKYGRGVIVAHERHDVVTIRFGNVRHIQMNVDSHDLFNPELPATLPPKQRRQSPRVRTDAASMGFRQFQRQQKDTIAAEFVTLTEAAKRLGISKSKLEQRMVQRNVSARFLANKEQIPITSLAVLVSK